MRPSPGEGGVPETDDGDRTPRLGHVDPQRLLDCFGGSISAHVLDRMRSEPRFADRMEDLVRFRFDLAEEDPTATTESIADRAALRLDRRALDALARRCGLVVWSASMAREVRRSVVEAMMDRFGEADFRRALGQRDLSDPAVAIASVERLAADVERDGRACLGAWLATLPAALRRRHALRWPMDADLPADRDGRFAARGPSIVRRVLAEGGMSPVSP